MRSKDKAAWAAALAIAALFPICCRRSGGGRSDTPQNEPQAGKSARWEVAYQSPQSLNNPEPQFWSYNSISVISPSVVFVAADYPAPGNLEKRVGLIVRTTDGGASWTEIPLNIKGIDLAALNSVKFVSPSAGWAVGVDDSGYTVVFRTTDAGQTWSGKKTSFKQSPTSVVFVGSDKGWVGGVAAPPNDPDAEGGPSDIIASNDGGSTWTPQYHLPVSVNDLSFPEAGAGWAAGIPASVYRTGDGGRTWGSQQTGLEGGAPDTSAASKFGVRTIDFVDTMHGWGGASSADDKKSVLLGTTNGGAKWEPLWTMNNDMIRDVHFVSQQEGWIVVENSEYAYHSTDGGHRWQSEPIRFPQHVSFYRIGAADSAHVWAVGGGAIIRRIEE